MMSVSGVGRLHIVEGRMNQYQYKRVLEQKLLSYMPKHFPNGGGILMQDGALEGNPKCCYPPISFSSRHLT